MHTRFALLALLFCTPARAQTLPLKTYDWLPGNDPVLKLSVMKDLKLDPSRLPSLVRESDGAVRLENPGGAPAAIAWSDLHLEAGTWTLRYRLRGPGHVSVVVGSSRWEGTVGSNWQEGALTQTVPGPVGPSSLAFSLGGRKGALEIGGLEWVRVPFSAQVRRASADQLELALDGQLPQGLQAEIRIGSLSQWQSLKDTPPEQSVPVMAALTRIDLPRLAGPTLLSWRLCDRQGRVVHSGGLLRVGSTTGTDHRGPHRETSITPDGFTLVNGQRFLPLGLYCQTRPDSLELCRKLGLNLAILGDTDQTVSVAKEAREQGLQVVIGGGVEGKAPDPSAAVGALLRRFAEVDPLAWSMVDEPEDKPDYQASLPTLYVAAAEADGRPVYQSLHNQNRLAAFLPGADITALDPYPIASVPRPIQTIADELDQARLLQEPGRSLWFINQAFEEAPNWMRAPTADELHAMTWLAFNHGARGLVYYSQAEIRASGLPGYRWDLAKSSLTEEIARETRELTKWKSFLLDGRGPVPVATRGSLDAARFPTTAGTLLVIVNLDDHTTRGNVAGEAQAVELPPYGVRLTL